jgi:hypothetical protein
VARRGGISVAYAHDIDPGTITFHDNAQNLRSKSVKKMLMLASYMILVFGLAEPGKAQADGRNTEHTFAQYADGRFFDGTYYRSTLLFTNPDSRSNGCVFRTYGVVPEMRDEFGNTVVTDTLRFTAPGSSWSVISSTATQGFAAGAATLFCDYPVTAQVLFSFFASNGVKLSEATVFSSPRGRTVKIIADQREGARLGLALTGESGTITCEIAALNATGGNIGTVTVSVPSNGNVSRFLDELIPRTAGQIGTVTIRNVGSSLPVYVIGLRFTGTAFTTIPVTVLEQ